MCLSIRAQVHVNAMWELTASALSTCDRITQDVKTKWEQVLCGRFQCQVSNYKLPANDLVPAAKKSQTFHLAIFDVSCMLWMIYIVLHTLLKKNVKIQTFCNFNLNKFDLLVSISKPALTKHPTHTVWLTGDFCEDLTDIRNCGTQRFDEPMIERGRQWGRGGERGMENRRSRGEGVCTVWERGVERARNSRQAISSSSLSQSDTWRPRANEQCVCGCADTVCTSETNGV